MLTVRSLTELTELSVGQVARLLGVSSRTAAGWFHGDPVPAGQQERLEELERIFTPLGQTAGARRRAILASSDGRSLLHRLIDRVPQAQQLQFQAGTVTGRLGV